MTKEVYTHQGRLMAESIREWDSVTILVQDNAVSADICFNFGNWYALMKF